MDQLDKFLRKRTKKERMMLMAIISLIVQQKVDGLDLKKLKGYSDLFRVRVRHFRIIFQRGKKENVILKIDERDDQTYRLNS